MKTSSGSASKLSRAWRPAPVYMVILDHIWMFISASYVRMAICFSSTPILCDLARRLTFMSGLSDVNANLCLFLRILYTLLPDDKLKFDTAEYDLGSRFLQVQFKILIWLVKYCGLRVLPPPLRPLYISYYGRAFEAMGFVRQAILKDGVRQVVILGAGFDTTAYRTRSIRISDSPTIDTIEFDCDNGQINRQHRNSVDKEGSRYVRLFEVDLPDVQRSKLHVLRHSLSPEKLEYYTEGVRYLECNFGVQSLVDVLLGGGYDPTLSTAFLWEGVTYYLSKEAVDATLSQIRELASMRDVASKELADKSDLDADGTVASPGEFSEADLQQSDVYLLMDYMHESETLGNKHNSWLWDLEQKLSNALGTPFITGFADVNRLLESKDFVVQSHTSRVDSEALLKTMSNYTSVLFENNSTAGQNEPNLAIVKAIFKPKDNNQ